ncbi:MAG: hypothetical protein ABW169_04820 [Sphingobium sp.]
MKVAVRGSGIAGGCCAHLLAMHGITAVLIPAERPPVPALLLSDPALALLRDVFGRPDLFADKPRVNRRIVAWGGGDAVVLPHGAVVVSEAELNAALCPTPHASDDAPHFTIHTAPPFPAPAMRRFGERSAMAAQVRLMQDEDHSACWVEAVQTGWLFLIPAADGSAWLLGIGGALDALIDHSRHIAPRIALTGKLSFAFETCPRMLTTLQGPDWLACGTAAIAFDPICGDGTAQSIREAIVASAVIAAMQDGGDVPALRTHYESMLIAAMRRHLQISAQFYRTGGTSDWWREQHDALVEGHHWCTARLAVLPEPRYQLRDFQLVAREAAA